MEEKYILVHDLGTTGNKAIIVDKELNLIDSGYTPFQSYYPQTNWVEQSPEEWWNAVIESTKGAIIKSGINPAQIAVVSFSAQMMSQTPVAKDGTLLMERIPIWADARAGEQAEVLHNYFGGIDEYYKIHGVGWQSEIHVSNKLKWLKDNTREIYNKTYNFFNI